MSGARLPKSVRVHGAREKPPTAEIDFTKPERAFIKANVGNLGGAKKFVLLIAFLAKGGVDVEIALADVEARWNRMTSLMGGKFNRFFSSSAREAGWVDVKKKGIYVLCQSWREALK